MFPVVNFLKYVPTAVVLFSDIALKTFDISQGSDRSVATHLRCDGIFIDSTINKFSPDSDSETSLKIGQYLTRLRRTKQSVSFLGPTL